MLWCSYIFFIAYPQLLSIEKAVYRLLFGTFRGDENYVRSRRSRSSLVQRVPLSTLRSVPNREGIARSVVMDDSSPAVSVAIESARTTSFPISKTISF